MRFAALASPHRGDKGGSAVFLQSQRPGRRFVFEQRKLNNVVTTTRTTQRRQPGRSSADRVQLVFFQSVGQFLHHNNAEPSATRPQNQHSMQRAIKAQALRETLQLPSHVDLNELARELKLSVIEAESDSFDGALLCSRNRLSGRILVKRSMREVGRKRFTIAHEIGHFILHRENQISCLPSDLRVGATTAKVLSGRPTASLRNYCCHPPTCSERLGTPGRHLNW